MEISIPGRQLTLSGLGAAIETAIDNNLGKVVSFEVPHCLMIAAHILMDSEEWPPEAGEVLHGMGFSSDIIKIRQHPGVLLDENWKIEFERGTVNVSY